MYIYKNNLIVFLHEILNIHHKFSVSRQYFTNKEIAKNRLQNAEIRGKFQEKVFF